MNSKHTMRWALLGLSLLLIPAVYAAPFAINTESFSNVMNQAWSLIGAMFSFEAIGRNPVIARGILKFLVFILVLRVVQKVAQMIPALGDNKTSAIIGFVIAAITVIFTPNTFIFSAIVALIVPLALIGGLAWWAVDKLKGSFPKAALGALVVLLDIFLLGLCIEMYQRWTDVEATYTPGFIMGIFDIVGVALMLLFIYKLISMFFNIGGSLGEDGGKAWKDRFKDWGENVKSFRDFKNVLRGADPPTVSNVVGTYVDPAHAKVTWDKINDTDEFKVKYYEIQYTYGTGRSRNWYRPVYPKRVKSVENKFIFGDLNLVKEKVKFRVRAISTHKRYGGWGYSNSEKLGPATPTTGTPRTDAAEETGTPPPPGGHAAAEIGALPGGGTPPAGTGAGGATAERTPPATPPAGGTPPATPPGTPALHPLIQQLINQQRLAEKHLSGAQRVLTTRFGNPRPGATPIVAGHGTPLAKHATLLFQRIRWGQAKLSEANATLNQINNLPGFPAGLNAADIGNLMNATTRQAALQTAMNITQAQSYVIQIV